MEMIKVVSKRAPYRTMYVRKRSWESSSIFVKVYGQPKYRIGTVVCKDKYEEPVSDRLQAERALDHLQSNIIHAALATVEPVNKKAKAILIVTKESPKVYLKALEQIAILNNFEIKGKGNKIYLNGTCMVLIDPSEDYLQIAGCQFATIIFDDQVVFDLSSDISAPCYLLSRLRPCFIK